MNILKNINQPYPFDLNIKRRLILNIAISIFIIITFLLLNIINTNSIYSILFIFGFGIITFIVLTINRIIIPRLFPRVFNEEIWTVIKEVLLILLSISSIGFLNLVYVNAGGYIKINIFTIIEAVVSTAIIGIIPIIIVILLQQNRLLKKYLSSANGLNSVINSSKYLGKYDQPVNEQVVLSSENGKDQLALMINDILVIKSVDNYIEVYWIGANEIKKTLLRSSLKRTDRLFSSYPTMFQCHRTYIINILHIKQITGNSQGYKLLMKGIDDLIPVSRNNSKILNQKIMNPQLQS